MVLRSLFSRNKQEGSKDNNNKNTFELVKNIDQNLKNIKYQLGEPEDLVIRQFHIGSSQDKCAIMYMDGIVDAAQIQSNIIQNVIVNIKEFQRPENTQGLFQFIHEQMIAVGKVEKTNIFDDVMIGILAGETVLFLDGVQHVLTMDTRGGENRAIQEPVTETLIRGPRDGFVENIGTNVALIRRRLKDSNLRIETHKTGRRGKRSLALIYIDGIVNPAILNEVKRRLKSIDIDDAPESGYIEEFIQDSFLSPFPQVISTERPDKVVASILNGRVSIMINGTPIVLLLPITIGDILKSREDYYERWTIGTLLRILRYLAAFIAIFLPPIYIALASYHPSMIPSLLAFSIAASREGVPFPAFIEAFLMAITMELLQEAGARLPQTIGQTIGIVGGLVIGEAAVQAGIVSPIMVIVTAITAIASFAVPIYSFAISLRILRLGFMIAAGLLGLYGIILVYIIVNIHLVNLKSFGIPMTAPFAPFFKEDWKDLIIRAPITTKKVRPKYLQTIDDVSTGKANKGDQK